MKIKELISEIKKCNIPIAYRVFKKTQTAPYMVYYRDSDDKTYADDKVYLNTSHYVLELYVDYRDLDIEAQIEKVFFDNEIPYSTDETYLTDEKLTEIIYEIDI